MMERRPTCIIDRITEEKYIPMSVIEDIKAEIKKKQYSCGDASEFQGMEFALEIIDKHATKMQ